MSFLKSIFGEPDEWKKYSCVVCGRKASGPLVWYYGGHEPGPYTGGADPEKKVDYTLPDNLRECCFCHNWYCSAHDGHIEQHRADVEEAKEAKRIAEAEARKPEWQKKIEAQQREESERWEQRWKQEAESRKRKQEEEEKAKLLRYQAKYFCHVCDKPSELSYSANVEDPDLRNWDNGPGDLDKCRICNNWTCWKCRHHGVCRKCGDKL